MNDGKSYCIHTYKDEPQHSMCETTENFKLIIIIYNQKQKDNGRCGVNYNKLSGVSNVFIFDYKQKKNY